MVRHRLSFELKGAGTTLGKNSTTSQGVTTREESPERFMYLTLPASAGLGGRRCTHPCALPAPVCPESPG